MHGETLKFRIFNFNSGRPVVFEIE